MGSNASVPDRAERIASATSGTASSLARFTSTLAHVERVEVLPFHQLGAGKWADLRLPYQLADVPPASPELVRRVEDQFRAHALTVV